MKSLKFSLIILILILVIVLIGYALKWYNLKTMIIVIFSILIGGYLGNKLIKK